MAMSAAMSALLVFAAAKADAQWRPIGRPPPGLPHYPREHFHDFILIEREVVHTVVTVPEEKPAAPPAAPAAPTEPRKPYVLGGTYSSIPGGCMKLIEDGASYYHCNGEWYRSVGSGNSTQYLAVREP